MKMTTADYELLRSLIAEELRLIGWTYAKALAQDYGDAVTCPHRAALWSVFYYVRRFHREELDSFSKYLASHIETALKKIFTDAGAPPALTPRKGK